MLRRATRSNLSGLAVRISEFWHQIHLLDKVLHNYTVSELVVHDDQIIWFRHSVGYVAVFCALHHCSIAWWATPTASQRPCPSPPARSVVPRGVDAIFHTGLIGLPADVQQNRAILQTRQNSVWSKFESVSTLLRSHFLGFCPSKLLNQKRKCLRNPDTRITQNQQQIFLTEHHKTSTFPWTSLSFMAWFDRGHCRSRLARHTGPGT